MSSDTLDALASRTRRRDALQCPHVSVRPLRLRAGDSVVVRSPAEILGTLDGYGTLDNLPFMPEMLAFCGKPFIVLNRVVQTTIDGAYLSRATKSFVREFHNNDVVTLKGVRCSGQQHDFCQRACAIFWKEAWLKRTGDDASNDRPPTQEQIQSTTDHLRHLLKTKINHRLYFCQSSEILKATRHLSRVQRIKKCLTAVVVGNISAWGMLKHLAVWTRWKLHYKFIGERVTGTLDKTPTAVLDLRPGDLVEIKPLPEIAATLNRHGRNRGLHFSADQPPLCGGRYRVRTRTVNFIAEGTGEMKHLQNTVTLEDVVCNSAYFAFGGCYRSDLLYWRDIWLRKIRPQLDSSVFTTPELTPMLCAIVVIRNPGYLRLSNNP